MIAIKHDKQYIYIYIYIYIYEGIYKERESGFFIPKV